MSKPKLIRITTIPGSLMILLQGQLRYMSQFYEVIGISSPKSGVNLKDVGKIEEIVTYPVEMKRTIAPFSDLKALFKLYLYFLKEKPLIVHTHTPKAGTIGMLAAYLAMIPIRLHTVAGMPLLEESGNKRKLLNIVEKITYRLATKVYPNSNGLKDIIIQNKLSKPDKLKVIGNGSSNGIDTSYFNREVISLTIINTLKKSLNLDTSTFVFLFVGRLVKDKGINELVAAFSKLSKKNRNARLLLVGPLEEKLDPLLPLTTKEIEINDQIISVGFQKDVRPYMAISNLFVFPSYREGFPNVVMQSGAMGLPSIVSDINGCNEIITNNENGFVIPPKNVEALYDTMMKAINDTSKLTCLSNNARNLIIDRYDRTFVWEKISDEYETHLKSKLKNYG